MSKEKPKNPTKGPTKVSSFRVFRGGGWNDGPDFLRSSPRNYYLSPSSRSISIGFRLVRTKK